MPNEEYNIFRFDMYGFYGMLFTYSQTSLGRISE